MRRRYQGLSCWCLLQRVKVYTAGSVAMTPTASLRTFIDHQNSFVSVLICSLSDYTKSRLSRDSEGLAEVRLEVAFEKIVMCMFLSDRLYIGIIMLRILDWWMCIILCYDLRAREVTLCYKQ